MNLIEQLGGYSAAKAEANATVKILNFLNYEELDKQLLEYRRQHNIYEAGDLIFDLSDDDKKYTGQILVVSEINLDFLVCHDKQGKRFCVIIDDAIHATDEEIKAGKRL